MAALPLTPLHHNDKQIYDEEKNVHDKDELGMCLEKRSNLPGRLLTIMELGGSHIGFYKCW